MENNLTWTEKPANSEDILCKLFLGGISPNSNEESLHSFYNKFGEIIDLNIVCYQNTDRSRGFGFVTYTDPSCVDRAQATRPHVVDGKTIDSKRVLPRAELTKNGGNNSGRKVFVGGLKEVHDEVSLKEHFQQYGNVLNVKVLVDKNTGRRRGFAYVEFEDNDSADKAAMRSHHTIQQLPVHVKKSKYKPETNKKFENNPNGSGQMNEASVPPQYSAAPYPPLYGYSPAPSYNSWGPPPPTPYPTQPPQQPPQWNGWGYNTARPQPNDTYQQSYNRGPGKITKLQGYRNKPYRV